MLGAALAALARPVVAASGGVASLEAVQEAVRDGLSMAVDEDQEARLFEVLEEALLHRDGPLRLTVDDRVADVTEIGARVVLTHRLTDEERAAGTIHLSPDLGVVATVAECDGGLHLPDGRSLTRHERRRRGEARDGGVLVTVDLEGPVGWLDGFPPGGVLSARAAGGFLTLELVDEADLAPPPADLAASLAASYDRANEGDGSPVLDEELQLVAALDRPAWFERPTVPFGELALAGGFELDGRLVGRPGCWEDYWRLSTVVAALARNEDLSRVESDLLLDALKAYDARRADPAVALPAGLRPQMARHWPVAPAVLDELRWRGAEAGSLAAFGEALGGAPGQWLAARAAALDGRAEDAERLARAGAAEDPSFGPLMAEVAWYAADRGNAREAVNLLHRVRHHDDPELVGLRRVAGLLAPTVGRNDRCPCGSGRKYKQCHLGRPQLPGLERVRWLLDKARTYLEYAAPPEVLADGVAAADDGQGGHMLGMDLLLFDEGWLARFAADRGPLLPEAERRALDAWTGGHVSAVFRAIRATAEGGAVLEDVATGERRAVEPSTVLSLATPDLLLWCRLVPLDDRWWTTGVGRRATLAERDRLVAALAPGAGPAARRAALLPEPGPPRLQNTSGDPLLLVRTTLDAGPAAELVAALDEHLGRDDDRLVWHIHEDTASMDAALVASLRLEEGELVVEANSVRRRDAVVARVQKLAGTARVVAEERVPPARARAAEEERDLASMAVRALGAGKLAGHLGEPGDFGEDEGDDLDDDLDGDLDGEEPDPELAAAMADYRAAQDEAWLDRSVPALGGRTPRQAAADDAACRDLRTLLAELELREGSDVAFLRSALGLAPPEAQPASGR